MVCVNTKADVINTALFIKSHVNAVVISTLKKKEKGITLPRCGPKSHVR